eukprot:TRINITY_DN10473_c0_g1_i1.p1 TRINITY_DN10473_c0_g1~~TRINITY_DN10473_c0_g1_i1.p1  ORF type:complete len:333 (-),score=54.23 TRINITY_DN10473_c0_g1_i1:61-1059(-)
MVVDHLSDKLSLKVAQLASELREIRLEATPREALESHRESHELASQPPTARQDTARAHRAAALHLALPVQPSHRGPVAGVRSEVTTERTVAQSTARGPAPVTTQRSRSVLADRPKQVSWRSQAAVGAIKAAARPHSSCTAAPPSRRDIPGYLKIQMGLFSTIHPPPVANTPVSTERLRGSKSLRQRKARHMLQTPKPPPKLTTREEMLRQYNKQAYGDYRPLNLVFPEQQSRYLAGGSVTGLNPTKAEAGKRKAIEQQQAQLKRQQAARQQGGLLNRAKVRQMPVRPPKQGPLFLNQMYVEETSQPSANWRPMFRGGNVTLLNGVDDGKREC